MNRPEAKRFLKELKHFAANDCDAEVAHRCMGLNKNTFLIRCIEMSQVLQVPIPWIGWFSAKDELKEQVKWQADQIRKDQRRKEKRHLNWDA